MKPRSSRVRLDVAVVERGLESSRERARARILAGEVRVDGRTVDKPGTAIPVAADVQLIGGGLRYVSRGGLKLEQALDAFGVDVTGREALDIGASTGGFTDCLLQRGAARVFAIDVGYGQLAWKLRSDPRVVVLERSNIRTLPREAVEGTPDLAVVDCSFIGLAKVLRPATAFMAAGADLIALVKPQFEVGPEHVARGGVVRDEKARALAIDRVRDEVSACGFEVLGGVDCDTHGPMGNVEYLIHARLDAPPAAATPTVPESP
jgi:23S rRNA (cytidine1920-2'-O)/16S rRNA (cytidine1409-2'-O)-methyltransferase